VRHIIRITLVVGTFSVAPVAAHAGFVWTDNAWTITKLSANAADVGSAESAFGAAATMNGQILNANADGAVAKAAASAIADPNAASDSDAAVEFQRAFQLVGPPNNWLLTLFGTLSGSLDANSANKNVAARSHVLGTAFIADKNNILFRIGGIPSAWDQTIAANKTLNIFSPMINSMVLPNGNYTVEGLLEVTAHVDQAPLAIASADSNFFNTMSVGLSATAVPEPSTLVMSTILFAILCMVWSYKWLKRSAVAA